MTNGPLITESQQLSPPGINPAVWGLLEIPATPGPDAGVILLPGSSGWKHEYARIARIIADAGMTALALDYYAVTGSYSAREEMLQKWPIWQATVRNAVDYLAACKMVSGRPIGLVGYSLGAFLAVSIAASLPHVKGVVDFFGGGVESDEELAQALRGFPPLLILHGDADSVVPVEQGYRLQKTILTQGGEVEMHIYPGAEHGFNAPWNPMYSESDAIDSVQRTIEFLHRKLGF